jgi:glycosyltransferase involved in cell wall biosynthesis
VKTICQQNKDAMGQDIDILMITYNRPEYTRLSLKRLLDTCDKDMRVWVWHNGTDEETLKVVQSFQGHPRLFKFHHSIKNCKLREPTNWFWAESKGGFVGKVDDDCLVPYHWADKLRQAHLDVPEFGIISCWHFFEEDFVPELANKKIKEYACGHRLMRNCFVGGSGYLMKRACLDEMGPIQPKETFTGYGLRLAICGWTNGWYYPFIYQEHMDDPRAPHTVLKTEEDFRHNMPLTAINFGIDSIEEWLQHLRNDAINIQTASINPKDFVGWRAKFRRLGKKLIRIVRQLWKRNGQH